MKKKCWIVLCVVFMLSVAAGCGSKSMETMSDFASGESSMNAAIENEDYKNEGEIAQRKESHQKMGWMDRWPPDGN